MHEADLTLATGGPGMVRSAYSSGKPALGVGAGNVPAIIDESADILMAVSSIIHSKTFDNGMICDSEQSVLVLDSIYDTVRQEFLDRGCYFLNQEEKDKLRAVILINGALNAVCRLSRRLWKRHRSCWRTAATVTPQRCTFLPVLPPIS